MRLLVPLLLTALPLWAAPAPFVPKKLTPVEAELKALQGEWVLVRGSTFGRGLVDIREPAGYTATIDGDLFTLWKDGFGVRSRIVLGPPLRPGELDLVCNTGFDPCDWKCMYRLRGETLKLAWPTIKNVAAGRPPTFESDGVTALEFKRKRP